MPSGPYKLDIAKQTSARVRALAADLADRPLRLVSRTGRENLGIATFKITGAPHITPYMVSIGP
jgi:hypothetical protein